MSILEKKALIDTNHKALSIIRQCELLGIARSSYYSAKEIFMLSDTAENLVLMRLIDEEYTRHPFYGSRKIRDYLRRLGHEVNRKRVQRLMRAMGLESVAPKPGTSKRNKAHAIYPYLLRNIIVSRANQVWCSDITYIRMHGGFAYLTAIMDWHSRKVLAWEISNTMEADFCVTALERALRLHCAPEIFNTDQGAQYTGNDFIAVLKANNIQISMDGKGRWMDNVFIERLWRSVKYEEVYLHEYQSLNELRQALSKYFQFYNDDRPHQSLSSLTPSEVYAEQNKIAA